MQKIFSQELRFKDENGEDYPVWEEKNLSEVSDIKTGNKDLKDKIFDGKYPFFVRSDNIERINSYSYDGEAILIPGDGRIGEVYHYINGKFDYHQRVYKISDFGENSGRYIYYYLKKNFYRQAIKNSVKATVDSLRLPTIKKMPIQLPNLSEQIKIANFLLYVDFKIEKIDKEIETNKVFKNGLMQQMFC
jgi:type I restriction enzyme S subunit